MSSSAKSVTRVAEMRAKRGARWLDENFPGWEKRINLRTLQLETGESCICGQVFKKKAEKPGSFAIDGFDYARTHLFAEANSWVTAIVGSPAGAPGRRDAVGTALGFVDGSVSQNRHYGCHPLKYKSDRTVVGYDDLQKAWVKLVQKRKAKSRRG